MWAIACSLALYEFGAFALMRRFLLRRYPGLALFHVEQSQPWSRWCLLAALVSGCLVTRLWGSWPQLALTVAILTPTLLALVIVDASTHRLPNPLTGTAGGVTAVAVALCGDLELATRVVLGALALGLFYFTLSLASGGMGVGLGDAKLAPTLGALAAWVGWSQWCLIAMLPFFMAAVWGIALVLRGAGRTARMPLGPLMIVSLVPALSIF